jgi:hypothetical protein
MKGCEYGPWSYQELLDQAGKASRGQTLQIVANIRILRK